MKKMMALLVILAVSGPLYLQAQQVKVLTYNIHHGENANGTVDLQGIANVILATNPDLVALQEVDSMTQRTQKINQLKELAALTGMYTYYSKSMDYDGGGYGNGILSRFPIAGGVTLALPYTKGNEPRSAGVVTVKLPGDSLLHFVSTHLDASDKDADRVQQVNFLVQHFSQINVPVILAGDLNAIPASKEITGLKHLFSDVTQQLGPTCPADTPKVKLDYILVHPKQRWNLTSTRIIEETVASDHRPVVAELELK